MRVWRIDNRVEPVRLGDLPKLRQRHTNRTQVDIHGAPRLVQRSEAHTSELQSLRHLVCRLLLEKNTEQMPVQRLPGPAQCLQVGSTLQDHSALLSQEPASGRAHPAPEAMAPGVPPFFLKMRAPAGSLTLPLTDPHRA